MHGLVGTVALVQRMAFVLVFAAAALATKKYLVAKKQSKY